MKNIFKQLFALVAVSICLLQAANAQQVQITFQLIPPYSPYISDYLVYQNKALLSITKLNTSTTQIYLRGSITGDNGVSAVTKPDYKSSTAIFLNGPTTVLHG